MIPMSDGRINRFFSSLIVWLTIHTYFLSIFQCVSSLFPMRSFVLVRSLLICYKNQCHKQFVLLFLGLHLRLHRHGVCTRKYGWISIIQIPHP
ncbi:hypothetical protein BDV06DRAFT_174339 [Aspergillus oleicola]